MSMEIIARSEELFHSGICWSDKSQYKTQLKSKLDGLTIEKDLDLEILSIQKKWLFPRASKLCFSFQVEVVYWISLQPKISITWNTYINPLRFFHRACLKFCFMPLLQRELYRVACHWNTHRIRPYPNQETEHGKADVLFFIPEMTERVL